MYKPAWDEIEQLYINSSVAASDIKLFQDLKNSQISHTKKEGNSRHYCSFFLPYDQAQNKIFLGHHIKADDWIPPGGHIEPGETPIQAAIREAEEELGISASATDLEAFNLSVKQINNEARGCLAHYDVWHLLKIPVQKIDFLKSEYYDAAWFTVEEGISHINKNPDFAAIISKLLC